MNTSNSAAPSGQSASGPMLQGAQPYHGHLNTLRPPPPRFWGPPPQFHGRGPVPYPLPPPPLYHVPPGFSVPPPPPPPCLMPLDTHGIATPSVNGDELWVNNWLQAKSLKEKTKTSCKKVVLFCEAQEKLKQWVETLEAMKEKYKDLREQSETCLESEWKVLWADVEKKKMRLMELVSLNFNEKSLQDLQKKVLRRKKKRLRLKRRLIERKEDSCLVQLRRQSLHQKADAWLADMQLTVERARKDEEWKKEADAVLSEVTRRQSEGRRQMALLEALKKLHQARMQMMDARGSRLSPEDSTKAERSLATFDRLLALWSNKIEEYSKEEHGLRVMLQESAAKKTDQELQNVRRILSEWETLLFGAQFSSDEPPDVNTLISIRFAWDQYLVPDGVAAPMASGIPVGWVLPTTPSSPEWQQLQPGN